MPTYQYACTACGEPLEAVQSFTDPPLTDCPACGGALRKVFSAVGVVFKGSGFYKTDSRKSAAVGEKKQDGTKGEGSKGDGSKGDGSKGDGSAKTESAPRADTSKTDSSKSPDKSASTSSAPAAKSA